MSRAEYSTSGVSSPTTFPATLSPNQNWVEVGIALDPMPVTTVSSTSTTTAVQSTSTVYSTLSSVSTVVTSTSTRFTTWSTASGGTVTIHVDQIDTFYAYLLMTLQRLISAPVGGFVEASNKLDVLMTWLTILGFAAAVTYVVVKTE